jgi:hypothetical protein
MLKEESNQSPSHLASPLLLLPLLKWVRRYFILHDLSEFDFSLPLLLLDEAMQRDVQIAGLPLGKPELIVLIGTPQQFEERMQFLETHLISCKSHQL